MTCISTVKSLLKRNGMKTKREDNPKTPIIPVQSHPYCALFPMLTGTDMAALTADIKENGLREPIVLRAGMILDGQNRQAACEAAGVRPEYEVYDGEDPLGFVISKNLSRRHLDAGQRAMIAAEIAKIPHGGERIKGQGANLRFDTVAQAAAKLDVSERSVDTAKAVTKKSPALAAEVKAGNISLNAASTAAKAPARRLKAAVEKGPEAINRLAAHFAKSKHAGITLDNLARSGVYTSAQAAPTAVDPRTPGQVNRDAYKAAHDLGKSKDECWEIAAQAVLKR